MQPAANPQQHSSSTSPRPAEPLPTKVEAIGFSTGPSNAITESQELPLSSPLHFGRSESRDSHPSAPAPAVRIVLGGHCRYERKARPTSLPARGH